MKGVCGAKFERTDIILEAEIVDKAVTALGHLKLLNDEMGKTFREGIAAEMNLVVKAVGQSVCVRCNSGGDVQPPEVNVLKATQNMLAEATSIYTYEDFTDFQSTIGFALRSLSATKDFDDFISVITRMLQNAPTVSNEQCMEFMKAVEPINVAKLDGGQQKMFEVGLLWRGFCYYHLVEGVEDGIAALP